MTKKTKNWDGEAFNSIELKSKIHKGLSVDLHWEVGEGVSGDYDETDPQDEPLLRFDVLFNGEQLDDSSYCTNLRADDSVKLLTKAVAVILGEAENSRTGDEEDNYGFRFKKVGERLSWMGIEKGKLV